MIHQRESLTLFRNRLVRAMHAAQQGRSKPQTREELQAFGDAVLDEIRAQGRRGEWSMLGASEMDGIELARLAFASDGGIDISFCFDETPIAEFVEAFGSPFLGNVSSSDVEFQ